MALVNVILFGTTLFLGILMVAIGLPLAGEKVKPNVYYGFRLRRAFASDPAWYAINRVGGREMVRWGVVTIVAAVGILFLPLAGNDPLVVVVALAPALLVLPPCWTAWRRSRDFPDPKR